jgi:hypothetical protein
VFLALAAVLAAAPATAVAQQKTTLIILHSDIGTPKVPVAELPTGVSLFTLHAEVDAKGEGKGKLSLDPNKHWFNEFGEVTKSTEKAGPDLEVTIKFVKKGTVKVGAGREEERFLYEIQGPQLKTRLTLVAPAKTFTSARLLVHDKDGHVEFVVPMHRFVPAPCHPGCFPAGTLVLTPKGPRAIDTIRAGDGVTVVRPDGTGVAGKVQSVFVTRNRLLKVETEAGDLLTTETQPLVLADGTIRAAGELQAGDRVFRWQDGKRQAVRVRAVHATDRVEQVFNLVLGDSEVFVADGFLARSKPPGLAAVEPTPAPPAALPAPRE